MQRPTPLKDVLEQALWAHWIGDKVYAERLLMYVISKAVVEKDIHVEAKASAAQEGQRYASTD